MPAKLKVLALIDHLALGGAEMLLGQFAAAAPSVGIELSVACLAERDGNPAAQPLREAGIEPITLSTPERLGLGAFVGVRSHIAEVRPHLVHTHLGSSDFLGSLAARSLRIAAVSTLHAMAWGRTASDRARFRLGALARRYGSARIIAVSQSARRVYLERGLVPPERVVVINNGVDVTAAPGAGVAVRRELGLGEHDLVLGMVSAVRPEKGHDIAIDAVARLASRDPSVRLLIAGDGPWLDEISRRAAPLGGRVVLAGRRHDVMRVLDAVDVCVQPSRADAFPTTLIEAMAAAVPVIATAVGGIPEIVLDGRTGLLIDAPPTGDAVAAAASRLLGDPALRRSLATTGRQRYEQEFTAGPWARRTRALYDTVLSEATMRRGAPAR